MNLYASLTQKGNKMPAQEYTIKQVSQQEPKRYEGKYGVTLYYKVRFEGSDETVEIGRKEGNPPKEGDRLYGQIEETEYGQKFKAERRPFEAHRAGNKPLRDDSAIQAQFAIKTAVAYLDNDEQATLDTVEQYAKDFFAMIERVKNSTQKPSLKQQWDKTLEAKNEDKPIPNDEVPLEAYEDIGLDTEVDLNNIPF